MESESTHSANDLTVRIRTAFAESVRLKQDSVDELAPEISRAARLMASALQAGRKILSCGNGGSAADAQHFAAEMVNRFERERPALPTIALTTDTSALTSIANDYRFADVFARQIAALGTEGDVLLAITTSGDSSNIASAVEAGHAKGLRVVLLNGRDGGRASPLLAEGDVEIRVPARSTPRIQEVHILIIHCLCDLIDHQLIPSNRRDPLHGR